MKSNLLRLLLLPLALAGCQPMQWSRPNTTDMQLQLDNKNCQSKAMGTNQAVKLQPNAPNSSSGSMAVQTEWQSCMRALGYTAKSRP